MVVTALPSAWAAKTVQDLTDSPSRRTVHAPHDEVSQPTLVPVNAKCSRRRWTSSVLGSTSATLSCPFTVTSTRTRPPFVGIVLVAEEELRTPIAMAHVPETSTKLVPVGFACEKDSLRLPGSPVSREPTGTCAPAPTLTACSDPSPHRNDARWRQQHTKVHSLGPCSTRS